MLKKHLSISSIEGNFLIKSVFTENLQIISYLMEMD